MILGYDHGYWVEWPRNCFGDVIRPHLVEGVARGRSADQTWQRVMSIYHIADDSQVEAREVFDLALRALREEGRVLPARAEVERAPAGPARTAAAGSQVRRPPAF